MYTTCTIGVCYGGVASPLEGIESVSGDTLGVENSLVAMWPCGFVAVVLLLPPRSSPSPLIDLTKFYNEKYVLIAYIKLQNLKPKIDIVR
jgi:hypothetical protein